MSPTGRWGLVVDVVVQAALCGLAGLVPFVLLQDSDTTVDHAVTVLSSGIAMAAAILLALGAWLSASGRAIRIAFAVMVYEVFLLMDAIAPDPTTSGLLVGNLALIGVAVLSGLALRRSTVVNRTWRTSALIGTTVVTGYVIVWPVPDTAMATRIQHALDVGVWVAAAITGLALVCHGSRGGMPLVRRTGLALLMLTAAPAVHATQALSPGRPSLAASALGLAGVAMLLTTAVPFAVDALRTMWCELADSQSRLLAAEQAMANSAARDHEMRNLVAGLAGAESVLAAQETSDDAPEDRRQLRAAARAELERLRRMLERDDIGLAPEGPASVVVAPVLSDLAALHRAGGAVIELTVPDDLQALMPPECLSHIVTNLLVNCARHAPGAPVSLTASRRDGHIVIQVTDDGPGLPPGMTAELLRPGTRGPSSTGTGLGLSVSAELAGRYGGVIRLVPTPAGGRGCTVMVELPAAAVGSPLPEQVVAA